jgi:hypothetical protein
MWTCYPEIKRPRDTRRFKDLAESVTDLLPRITEVFRRFFGAYSRSTARMAMDAQGFFAMHQGAT